LSRPLSPRSGLKILTDKEQYYLDLLSPEYNIAPTAGSTLGFKHSPISKKKISEALSATIYQFSLDLQLLNTFPSSIVAAK
jgi:hypothetical protein